MGSSRCYRHRATSLPSVHAGSDRRWKQSHRRGRRERARGRRQCDRRLHRSRVCRRCRRGPPDRSDGRRLPPRLGRRRGDRARLLLRRAVRRSARSRTSSSTSATRRRATTSATGSVAVPGLVAGLEEAHRRFGSMPWPQLVEPAIELARQGFDATDAQRFLHLILAGDPPARRGRAADLRRRRADRDRRLRRDARAHPRRAARRPSPS